MHDDSSASKTALMVCAYRARASVRPDPVCSDRWAAALAGDEGMELAAAFDKSFAHMELWMALRTAYLDAHVTRWTGPDYGFDQVVVLGAGLDTRAERLARDGVRFFEVDHPATQAHKRERLAALDGYPLDAAVYTPCDFEKGQDFLAQLEGAGFEPSRPAVILWEGVTAYLTDEAVRGTAGRIAGGCNDRSILVFDYLSKRMAQGTRIREKDQETRAYVDQLGEPIRFGTNDILPLLYDEGFRYVHTLNFDEIALSVTGTYDRAREFRFQMIAVASRTPPDLL